MEDNLEGAKAKLAEYEESLESMERSETDERLGDATRKLAILRSNEAIMVRRYQALEESESLLRNETSRLKEEIVTIENSIMIKLGDLQRFAKAFSYRSQSLSVRCLGSSFKGEPGLSKRTW